jgi:predicted component of type VI protein secretion system
MPTLLLKFKNTVLQELPITKTPIMIGREHNNDIVIDNLSVSRYHIKIHQEESDYIVEDLDSGNGSLLNDSKLTKCPLRDNDEISVGKHTIIFLDNGSNDVKLGEEIDTTSLAEQTFLLNAKSLPEIMALRSGKPLGVEQNTAVKDEKLEASPSQNAVHVVTGKPTEQEKSILQPQEPQLEGEIEFISGNSLPNRIKLTKRTTLGGKSDKADIKFRGLLVGGIAFIISKKNNSFYITHSEGWRKTKVNGVTLRKPCELKDGFMITVGTNKLIFHATTGVELNR